MHYKIKKLVLKLKIDYKINIVIINNQIRKNLKNFKCNKTIQWMKKKIIMNQTKIQFINKLYFKNLNNKYFSSLKIKHRYNNQINKPHNNIIHHIIKF